MPGVNSNGFVHPSSKEMEQMGDAIPSIANLQFTIAQEKVTPFGYTLIRWYNNPTSETLFVLKENTPVQRGWGTYIFNPQVNFDCAVEAPHPIWDTKSWRLAVQGYLRLRARWFLMAGTHRYANTDSSSDVAHSTNTIFHKVHTVIAPEISVQIHGFDKSSSIYTGYPDVVISAGTIYPDNVLFSVKTAYEAQGFTAGVYSLSTQSSLWRLGATTNKQGQWSNTNGKIFIHIEHDTPIRTDTAKTLKAVHALEEALIPTTDAGYSSSLQMRQSCLDQNYPNPFNPATTITFYVETEGWVKLKVVDLQGREVALLTYERFHPGQYTRSWDASRSGAAGGMYLFVLENGNVTETKKMLFIQ